MSFYLKGCRVSYLKKIMKIVEKERVLKTSDYSLFKIDDNYKFSKIKLESLEIEMGIKNLCQDLPILIDENFNILDGKYKFTASKNLKLPIYYKVCVVSNKVDLLKAKEINFKPTIHDYLMAHSDKLLYRKIVDWKNVLKFSYSDIIDSIIDFDYKNHPKCKESKKFKDGLYEYDRKYDFIFKKLSEFINRFNVEFEGLNFKLSQVKSILVENSYNIDNSFNQIYKSKYVNEYLILAKEHHPSICNIFDYIYEVECFYMEHNLDNVNDMDKAYGVYNKWSDAYDYPTYYKYPTLRLIESYLGKTIFIKN